MPDYFTHSILSQEIFERLDRSHRLMITDRKLYALGAQGGDVLFMYNLNRRRNLGRSLHMYDAAGTFEKLKGANPSYAAGYATHYALDSALHPAVYAFAEKCRAPFAHLAFERDIGLYVSRRTGVPRKIMPREDVCGAAEAVYDAISRLLPQITPEGTVRCLKRYFAYTRAIYMRKRQTYSFDYDYSLSCFQVAFDCHVLIDVEKEGRFRNICKSFIDKSCLAGAEVAKDDDHAAAFAANPIKCILQILNLGCSLVKRVFLIQDFSPVRRLASVFSPEAQSLICNVAFFAFKINSVQMFEDDLVTSYI